MRAMNEVLKAAEEDFLYIVGNYIIPLLPVSGKTRISHESSDDVTNFIMFREPRKMLYIYPTKEKPPFFVEMQLTTSTPSLKAAESILSEIMKVSQFAYENENVRKTDAYDLKICGKYVYRVKRYELAYEIGISNWLGSVSTFRLIDKLDAWTRKTYEGKKVPFGFLINTDKKNTGCEDFISFLECNHSAVFTDGIASGIQLDCNGLILQYFSTDDSTGSITETVLSPNVLQQFAARCGKDSKGSNWIGVISLVNGDILIFRRRELVFAKRNNRWVYFNTNNIWMNIREFISLAPHEDEDEKNKVLDAHAKDIYLSLLDVSFSHKGGCLAIIRRDQIDKVITDYVPNDYLYKKQGLNSDSQQKRRILRRLLQITQKDDEVFFYQIDRNLRLDILSLDGATIIDEYGKIHATGAIVKIGPEGSNEGGRTAAAKELSKYGLGIKVSEDGHIQGYRGVKRMEKGEGKIISDLLFMIK